MPDEAASNLSGDEHREGDALALLLDPRLPWLWSMAELARELGGDLLAADAVTGLYVAGLVHRCGEFVFASRAAVHLSRLSGWP
jgi:hypothetical protein